jgi:hypothetical protein
MRMLRGIAGAVIWLLAAVLGLVAVVSCITIILLPIGLWLLGRSRRLFGIAVRLMLPRDMAHPVKESRKQLRHAGKQAKRSKAGKEVAARRTSAPFSCRTTLRRHGTAKGSPNHSPVSHVLISGCGCSEQS